MSTMLEPMVCCAPLAAPGLSDEEAEATADLFKALADPEQRGKWAYFALKRDAVEKLATVADLKGVCC